MKSLTTLFALSVALTAVVRGEELRLGASIPARSLVPLLERAFSGARPATRLVTEVTDTAKVLDRVRSEQIQVGILTRNLKQPELEEIPALVAQPIGTDALVLTVPASNPVKGLTGDQIRAIWAGAIVNWRELGGPDLPIQVIGRTKKYDPIQLFGDFMKLESQFGESSAQFRVKGQPAWSATKALVFDSDEAALRALLGDAGAISYFPIARFLDDQANRVAIKGLVLDGVEATAATVADKGAYYLRRTLNVFTKGPPDAASKDFIQFILSVEGQQLISNAGFMPLTAAAAVREFRTTNHRP